MAGMLRPFFALAIATLAAAGPSLPSASARAGPPVSPAGPAAVLAASPLSWSAPALVDHQAPFGNPPGLGGVSCPTPTFCVAVGWTGDGVGNIATSTNPTGGVDAWKVVYHVDDSSLIFDVSCPSTTLCVAIDAAGDVITSTDPTGGAEAWTITNVDGHYLNAISCPSVSLCVIADNDGNVITSTQPAGGAGMWTLTNVDGFKGLEGISCPTVSLCVAVDYSGNVVTATNPTGGAGAWTVVNVDGYQNHSLNAVACPTASLCVVADDEGDVITTATPTGGSDAWTTTNLATAEWFYAAISCPSASLCVLAVTDWSGSSPVTSVLTSTNPSGGAGAWFSAAVPLSYLSCPSDSLCVATTGSEIVTSTDPTGGVDAWTATGLGFSGLTAISCPSTSLCVAVDDAGNVLTSTDPAGGSWTFAHVHGRVFTALSCPSTSLCVAVDEAGNVVTTTDLTGAGAWTAVNVDGTHRLWSVSCASASLCVAGDGVGNVVTSTNPTGGAGAWAVTHVDNATTGLNYLSGLSCPSATLCLAVDGAGNMFTSTNPAGGAAAWSSAHVSGPGLLAVSCPSMALCVAVGYAGTLVTVTGAGTAAYTVDSSRRLTSVSCSSAALCVAGDVDGAVVISTDPTGGAGAWTSASVDAGNALSAVSCPSDLLCVAGDGVGNVVVGARVQHLLTVGTAGSGSGTVTSTDGHIGCGSVCSYLYDQGTAVALTAAASADSTFAGWTGAGCTGTGACQVTMNTAQDVTATFTARVPTNLTRPVITGTARLGRTLTCSTGTWTWSPTSFTRRWYRNGTAISGATASTHPVVTADLQRKLTCGVLATNAGGSSARATSLPVTVVAVTVLTGRQTTKAGAVRACGASTSPCRDAQGATIYLGGTATPVPVPAATRSVTVRFYYRSGGVWRLKATSTVQAASTSGTWRLTRTGATSLKGNWRVRASTAATNTLTSATSTYRYYRVY